MEIQLLPSTLSGHDVLNGVFGDGQQINNNANGIQFAHCQFTNLCMGSVLQYAGPNKPSTSSDTQELLHNTAQHWDSNPHASLGRCPIDLATRAMYKLEAVRSTSTVDQFSGLDAANCLPVCSEVNPTAPRLSSKWIKHARKFGRKLLEGGLSRVNIDLHGKSGEWKLNFEWKREGHVSL